MNSFSASRSLTTAAPVRACATSRAAVQSAALKTSQVRMAVLGAASAVLLTVPPMGHASDFVSKVQAKKDAEKQQMAKLEKIFDQELKKTKPVVAQVAGKAPQVVN